MKTTIDLYQFRSAFDRANRGSNFSYEGLAVLFDYLEEYEQDTGEEIELDVIAICGEFAEASPVEIADNYNLDIDADSDDDEIADAVRMHLEDEGFYVGTTDDGSIVYRQF